MSRLRRIPPRDLEALSAHLDGQLSPQDADRLEARLKQDASLRAALEDLRITRHLFRSLPVLRPPRSFSLTPEMVGVRPVRSTYPALRLATALATIAFLAVSGVGMLGRGVMAPAAAPAPMAAEVEAFQLAEAPEGAVVEEAAAADEAPQEPPLADRLSPTKTPASGMRALAGETPAAESNGVVGPGGGGGLPPEGPPQVFAAEPAGTLAPTVVVEAMAPPPAEPDLTPTESPTLEAVLEAPVGMVTAAPDESEAYRPPVHGLSALNWVQLGLGGLAIGLGLLTIFLRRPAA